MQAEELSPHRPSTAPTSYRRRSVADAQLVAAWRDALAMAHVRAALTEEKPVVRIARDLDFEAAYLHRRFARSHGLTPSMWRKAPAIPVPALAHDWDSVLHYFNAAKPQQDLGPHRESR